MSVCGSEGMKRLSNLYNGVCVSVALYIYVHDTESTPVRDVSALTSSFSLITRLKISTQTRMRTLSGI